MGILGWTLIVIGSGGLWAAVILEIKSRAKVYEILMKIFPWVLGVGYLLIR